jgi:hypothetical protein
MDKNRPSKFDGYPEDLAVGLEIENGEVIGRNPRSMTEEELNSLGHENTPLLKIIRAKCLDCSHSTQEVRKCTCAKTCPLWPYRMRKNPFLKPRKMSEEQIEVARERFAKVRADASKKSAK